MKDQAPSRLWQPALTIPARERSSSQGSPERQEPRRESSRLGRAWTWIKDSPSEYRWSLLLTLVVLCPLFLFFPGSGDSLREGAEQNSAGRKVAHAEKARSRAQESPANVGVEAGEPIDDLASTLLETIRTGTFESPEDVATGRFLDNFDAKVGRLANLDTTRLQTRRRGERWVQVDVPCAAAEGEKSPFTVARLRLVNDGERWKLENLKLLP